MNWVKTCWTDSMDTICLNIFHFENVTFLKMIVDKHKPIIEHLYLLKESKDNIEYELIEMR